MAKLEKSQYIGIVENTDPCFHLEIFDNLYLGNIIITKRLTDKLIEKLVENKDKCILHFTITGFGNTKVEPFVPSVEQSYFGLTLIVYLLMQMLCIQKRLKTRLYECLQVLGLYRLKAD